MASQITRFALKSAQNLVHQKVAVRCMSAGANPKIQARQELFMKDDDIPVHIKGGVMDQILYRTTMGACILAIGLFAYNMIVMANPKPK